MLRRREVYAAWCSIYLFFILILPLLFTVPLYAADPVDPVDPGRYQALAIEKKLASSREWEVLLHYRPVGAARESLVDDLRFFLAKEGKTDPAAELAATIAGIFAPAEQGDKHPQCLFPARTAWLGKELGFEDAHLPHPVCGKLNETMKAIDPRSAVLVFPSAHNNGPASMFGHTLIKVGSSFKSELLSQAVNYAAHATDTNGLLYAFKGIFGFYPGYYSILPYYEKLKEYGDLEHRDVWEYQLALTPAEVRQMVLHIWELQDIRSEYFFFDENCSFNLLFLLEAARPDLRLAEEYWERSAFWVIPADTIATVRRAGIIERVNYRPAQSTRIQHRASLLSDGNQELAYRIAMKRISSDDAALALLPLEEKRQTFDLAAEYLQFRYSRQDLPQEQFQAQFLPILKARSALGQGELDAGKVPEPPQPEAGHLPAKFSLGGGERHGEGFLQVAWQPAYHDLMDAEAGYTKGAQINFMSVSGRYFPRHGRVVLQSLRPVDIVSISPRNRFFQPVSWKVNGGLDRKILADGGDRLIFRLNTGGGVAWETALLGIFYGFVEADLNITDRFRNKAAVGGGGTVGTLWHPASRWSIHLHGTAFSYLLEKHQEYRVALDQQFHAGKQWALGLRAGWEQSFGHSKSEALLEIIRYY